MPHPIRISAPIDTLDLRVRRLRIPRARQMQLRAMMEEARKQLTVYEVDLSSALGGGADAEYATETGKKFLHASTTY